MKFFKAIGQWTLKIFEVVRKLVHELQCILMLFKSKRGHNLVKMLYRVTISWLVVVIMMVNKYAKVQRNRSMDFENV